MRLFAHVARFLLASPTPSAVRVDLGGRCVCGHNQIDHVDGGWCEGRVCGCSIFEARPSWLDTWGPLPEPVADDVDPDAHPVHVPTSAGMPAALRMWWGIPG